MLVLKRRLSTRVKLVLPTGETIWVSVERINQNAIHLGFDAPSDVKILREEIADEGQAEHQSEE